MVSVEADNKLFPIFLKLEQLNVLIVGGGNVGLEKIRALLHNSPKVHIVLISITILPEIEVLLKLHPNVTIHKRAFAESDLEGQDILISAVNNKVLSETIKTAANKKGILTNVADMPDLCDFYLGSIVKKGDLKIAISTNGKSPTMAKRIKEILQEAIPDNTQEVLDNLHNIRNSLKGDFEYKVKRLNEITTDLKAPKRNANLLSWEAFTGTGASAVYLHPAQLHAGWDQ
jgi:siroheme synthase-like protein